MEGLIGKKIGMTQVYDAQGQRIPVTVIEAGPCVVVQRKTVARDGYDAVQLGFGAQKEHRVVKPALARFKLAGVPAMRCLREFAVTDADEINVGDSLTASMFDGVGYADIMGITKGKGFQGVVKRHRMHGGRMTHGGHSKRRVGSIGQCETPARVAKGRRLPGHTGRVRVTTQNLKIIEVRGDDNLILVEGAVPGPSGAIVIVKKALKKAGKA